MEANERFTLPTEILETDLVALNIPKRALNPLLRAGVHTVGQVVDLGDVGIHSIYNIGPGLADLILTEVTEFCSLPRTALTISIASELISPPIDLPSEILELSIDCIGITSSRATNALKKNSIETLNDLLQARRRGLENVRGLGERGILSVESAVNAIIADAKIAPAELLLHIQRSQGESKSPLLEIDHSPPNLILLIVPFTRTVLEIVHKDHRAYTLLKHYYGLETGKTYTLQEIGDAEGITRERVRQINARSLERVRHALFGRTSYKQWSVPTELVDEVTLLKQLFEDMGAVVQESALIKTIADRCGHPVKNTHLAPLEFLLTVFGFKKFSERYLGYGGSNIAAWILDSQLSTDNIWKALIGVYRTLQESITPLSLFELKMGVNRKRKSKFSDESIRNALRICQDVEIVGESHYQLKLTRLSSVAEQAYRVLSVSGQPLHFRSIAKEINHILAGAGYPPNVQVRNLVGQMVADARFAPIGKSGLWALAEWSHIHTETTVELMEEYFHLKKERATVDEIHGYVITKRPNIPKESIVTYLYEKDAFTRVSATEYELTVWGSKPYQPANRGRRSMAERIEPVLESVFEDEQNSEVALIELVREIEKQTNISASNIYTWLSRSETIETYKDSKDPRRKLVRYIRVDSSTSQRGRVTLKQRIQEEIKIYLRGQPGKRASLAEVANFVMRKTACKKHTFYTYLSRMEDVKKEKVNGVWYCYLITETEGATLPFVFPQLAQITEEPLRGNIERAIELLTLDNVDVGLFQLGKILEGELKEFLWEAGKKKVLNVSKNDVRRLVDMIDCVVREGVITKKYELSFLREERNERAHGKIPTEAEREKLLQYAPFLAGLYIDYVIIFHKRGLEL